MVYPIHTFARNGQWSPQKTADQDACYRDNYPGFLPSMQKKQTGVALTAFGVATTAWREDGKNTAAAEVAIACGGHVVCRDYLF